MTKTNSAALQEKGLKIPSAASLERGSGLLLHISSLPSPYGIGDLGPEAYRFVDLLHQAKQKYWQLLPLNPTEAFNGDCPYSSVSVFAGNTLFISPEMLVKEGVIAAGDLPTDMPVFSAEKVSFAPVRVFKEKLFQAVCDRFQKKAPAHLQKEYKKFCAEQRYWLEDFALYSVIKGQMGGQPWTRWPAELRGRQAKAIEKARAACLGEMEKVKILQYLFYHQWNALKAYANQREVQVIGDITIYVSPDSADVWTHASLFKLDAQGTPTVVGGVPPDYFSKTGQRWGNPVYNWDVLKESGYAWWVNRLRHNLTMFDVARIDHFRGLVQYWEIPADHPTAMQGRWVDVPVDDFLRVLSASLPSLPFIAEDLGIITSDVAAVMNRCGFPGMKILLFAFDGDTATHPYIPENYQNENCVVYTGTHDNNTIRGWFEYEASFETKKKIFEYFETEIPVDDLHWVFIELAMDSVARLAVIPLQDVLGLGQEARMNVPGTAQNNWLWRWQPQGSTKDMAQRLARLAKLSERA